MFVLCIFTLQHVLTRAIELRGWPPSGVWLQSLTIGALAMALVVLPLSILIVSVGARRRLRSLRQERAVRMALAQRLLALQI